MFVPTRVDTVEAKIVYGAVDEHGFQAVNIDIPGIGILICEHNPGRGEIVDLGFDWNPETAYRAMFPSWATEGVYDHEEEGTA